MKKKTGSVFIRTFVRSVLYLGVFFLLFLGSYKLTGLYLQREGKKIVSSKEPNMKTTGKVDTVAYNLIYSVDDSEKKVDHVLLEVLNTRTDTLTYLTIPVKTRMAMSSEHYQEVLKKNKEIPQIISFRSFKQYMNEADYYDFGVELLKDALGIQISYYTIVPDSMFEQIFEQGKNGFQLSKAMQKTLKDYQQQDIISYLTDFYKSTKCNLSLDSRLTYTPSLEKVKSKQIIYGKLPGENDGSGYVPDIETIDKLVERMNEDGSEDEIRGILGSMDKVSLDKNIEMLNGSGITGLAKEVSSRIGEAGYHVTSVGNYSSSDVSETIIYVKEEGIGQDLLSYLHSASIQVKEDMPYGVDIQVVLGKSESES